jgi:MoaA/NifB/PqqE/SkfB family radical SAM enzyme
VKKLWRYRHLVGSRRFGVSLWHSRKNVLAAGCGRSPAAGPYMAELDVTYRCNCRCLMCQRWQDPREGELRLAEYRDLAREFHELGVCQVSIAGGEPLLRRDLPSIVAAFAGLGMSVNVCTNGILLEEHAELLSRSGASCVTVSLDGATAETHEKARGAPGSFVKIGRGIRHLKECSPHARPLVRVRMTVSNINVEELRAYYLKWEPVVDHVLIQAAHYSPEAFYTGLDPQAFQLGHEKLAGQVTGLPLAKESYVKSLIASLRKSGGFPRHRCYAGILMVRVDPWGNVYPCLEQHVRVGSLRERGFKTIWESSRFDHVRREVANDDQCRCWYNNTALISRYGGWLRLSTGRGLRQKLARVFHRIPELAGLQKDACGGPGRFVEVLGKEPSQQHENDQRDREQLCGSREGNGGKIFAGF